MQPSLSVRHQILRTLLPTMLFMSAVLSPAVVRAEEPVAVLVTGPLSAKVGDRVAFEVELVNRSGKPLEKLRVIDYFDKGFHHEASASPIEQTGTVDLAAGTSRRLTLDFLLDEPGRQCHRVEILDQSHTFVGGATSCVQVAASTVAAATPLAAPLPSAPAPAAAPVLSAVAGPVRAHAQAPIPLPPAAMLWTTLATLQRTPQLFAPSSSGGALHEARRARRPPPPLRWRTCS